jgi:serine/threonine protein kinase
MGEGWRARDERLARDVAIKFLLPPASHVERLRAFEREARAAGTLNHPNVLTVYDVGEYHGAPFLVTECLEGESLRTRPGAGALPVDAALEIANHVARGLATLLDAAGETPASQASSVTVARSWVAGTAGYMAPEQVRGDTVDQRADIFAPGAVLRDARRASALQGGAHIRHPGRPA